jgi:hypothetical protein
MTTQPYSNIGPYKGVPKDVVAECAQRSNATHEASIIALSRHARNLGDTPIREATIRSSVSVLNGAWKAVETDTASSHKSARGDVFASFLIPTMLWIPTVAALCLAFRHTPEGPFPLIMSVTPLFILLFALNWTFVGHRGLAAIREIRRQGYLDDALPEALEPLAGKSILVGTKGLHCADRDETGKIAVKTIYWDAVGHASSDVDVNGIEVVTIHGRDGSVLASVSGPEGCRDANGLVELIASAVDTARKPA